MRKMIINVVVVMCFFGIIMSWLVSPSCASESDLHQVQLKDLCVYPDGENGNAHLFVRDHRVRTGNFMPFEHSSEILLLNTTTLETIASHDLGDKEVIHFTPLHLMNFLLTYVSYQSGVMVDAGFCKGAYDSEEKKFHIVEYKTFPFVIEGIYRMSESNWILGRVFVVSHTDQGEYKIEDFSTTSGLRLIHEFQSAGARVIFGSIDDQLQSYLMAIETPGSEAKSLKMFEIESTGSSFLAQTTLQKNANVSGLHAWTSRGKLRIEVIMAVDKTKTLLVN